MPLDNANPSDEAEKPTGSLRTFHIVFVAAAIFVCAVFGLWAVIDYRQSGGSGSLIMAVFAGVVIVALVVYGKWFWSKIQQHKIS